MIASSLDVAVQGDKMLGCYGFLTKEQWEAEQDAFDAIQREAWAANGAADLLPALERDQREFRQQWPETWARNAGTAISLPAIASETRAGADRCAGLGRSA